MADLSPSQLADLRLTYYIACGLSLIGSQYILYLLRDSNSRKALTTKFVFYLAICDWLTALSGLFGAFGLSSLEEDTAEMDDSLCKTQAFIIHFSNMAATFWSVSIAVVVYRQTVLLDLNVNKLEPYFHLVSWGFPSISLIIIIALKRLGPQKLWCWVLEDEYNLKYYIFYIPVAITLIVGIVIYFKIQRFLSTHIKESESYGSILPGHLMLEKSVSDRTIQLFLVFFFCWCWTLVNRVYHDIHKDKIQMSLMYLNFFLTPLEGFCNAVIYGRIVYQKEEALTKQKMVSFHGTRDSSSVESIFRSDYGSDETSDEKASKTEGLQDRMRAPLLGNIA